MTHLNGALLVATEFFIHLFEAAKEGGKMERGVCKKH